MSETLSRLFFPVRLRNFTLGPEWTTCRLSPVQTPSAPPLPSSFSTSTTPGRLLQCSFTLLARVLFQTRAAVCHGWQASEAGSSFCLSSPAAPALIGNSPRLPSGLLSSVLTCKPARLSRLSGPAGQLLAAISGLCYTRQNYLVVSVCHFWVISGCWESECINQRLLRQGGGGRGRDGSFRQGLAGQDLQS